MPSYQYPQPYLPWKVIRDVSQCPAPVAGVITFPDNSGPYYFDGVVDFGGLELILGRNVFMAASQEDGGIKNAVVQVNDTCAVRFMLFDNVQITIDASGGAFDWQFVNFYNSANCLNVVAAANFIGETVGFINSYGVKISGAIDSFVLSPNCIWRDIDQTDAVFLELTSTAVINRRLRVQDSVFATGFAGQTAVRVDVSASIPIESFIFKTVRQTGPGTFLDGINGDSDEAFFFEVVGGNAINSTAIANMYMKNNATATPISVIGDRYAMAGVTEFGPTRQRFSHDVATNTLEYTSSVPRIFRIQCSYTVLSGSNNIIGVYVGINRTGAALDPDADRVTESEMYTTTSGSRPDSGVAQCIATLNEGDRVYVIVQNNTSTNDVTIEFMNMIIEKASV
jgi:hypothetical protein